MAEINALKQTTLKKVELVQHTIDTIPDNSIMPTNVVISDVSPFACSLSLLFPIQTTMERITGIVVHSRYHKGDVSKPLDEVSFYFSPSEIQFDANCISLHFNALLPNVFADLTVLPRESYDVDSVRGGRSACFCANCDNRCARWRNGRSERVDFSDIRSMDG